MVKYLRVLIDRLKLFKSGMQSNADVWVGHPETEASVQDRIDRLTAKKNRNI